MRRQRGTKMIATLGPASSDPDCILKLAQAGVDVFRLNFSHGSHADHRHNFEAVRAAEKVLGWPVGVLMDMQGPKLRIGEFGDGSVTLKDGQAFRLDRDPTPGDANRVYLPHPELFEALRPTTPLLLDDGRLRLEVMAVDADVIETRVWHGGELSNHKGVNAPAVLLPLSALTDKDIEDLEFGLELGVDWVAASFVQKPEDVKALQARVNGRAGVLSKLEKPAALNCLEEIVAASDAIMVARGDLGVELPPERVPGQQKKIIRECRRAGKPVVVATQMLESMVQSPVPTRAEVSDVATAAFDGADAVMLSAETATGDYPLETVSVMDRILSTTEQEPGYRSSLSSGAPKPEATTSDTISSALNVAADILPIAAIATYTESGFTGLRASRERPQAPVLCLTPRAHTARRLTLAWGALPVPVSPAKSIDEAVRVARKIAVEEGVAVAGDTIVITAGLPLNKPGTTNLLRIAHA